MTGPLYSLAVRRHQASRRLQRARNSPDLHAELGVFLVFPGFAGVSSLAVDCEQTAYISPKPVE